MAHTRDDVDRSSALAQARRAAVSLAQSMARSGALGDGKPGCRAAVHGWLRRLVEAVRAPSNRPSDTRVMDAALSNMAPALIQALGERSWHVLVVVQSSAAAMIDSVPRPLVSVLVMHDIRARLYERRAGVAGSSSSDGVCAARHGGIAPSSASTVGGSIWS